MASCSSTLFLVVLVAISAIMTATPSTAIGISITPGPPTNVVTDMIMIDGFLNCRINTASFLDGGIFLGNPLTFLDTAAQLRCGNKVLAETTEFFSGIFRITMNSPRNDVQALRNFLVAPASNCTVAVTTPRRSCNAILPAGITTLVASLLPGPTENLDGGGEILHLVLAGPPPPM